MDKDKFGEEFCVSAGTVKNAVEKIRKIGGNDCSGRCVYE